LAEFYSFKMGNNTYKFLLVVVDVASNKIFAKPLASKSSRDVRKGFLKIFKEAKILPTKLETDR
jgi:hypothetical protein